MDEVSEAELVETARLGGVIDCGAGRAGRRVSAALIRRCCLSLKGQVDPRGLRFRKAVVAGGLDLAGLDLPFPVRFDECEFDSALMVEGAQLAELALTRCPRLPGLLGNGLPLTFGSGCFNRGDVFSEGCWEAGVPDSCCEATAATGVAAAVATMPATRMPLAIRIPLMIALLFSLR